ncbi:MAG TPA: hypothetical protein DGP89_03520, partial [Saprospirales bacterium]|nr:hypothetical protein [Saprospirales bacterium]
MRHLIYVIYILVSSISLHAQEFSPIVNLTLGNLMGGETSSLTYSMSQDNGESEIYSSSVVSDGGSFNLSGLSVNDNIGSGTLFLELYAGDYSLESDLIVSNINNDFYTVFNYVTASNSPDFGVGDIAGGFVISNTETGINIYTEIPGDEDFISEAYNMSLTFDDIFINPAQGSFTFTSTLTTELGDIDVQEFAFDVIVINGCMDPTSLTYNANANISDPSMCCYIGGCIDPAATNYDPNACFNTISCNFLVNNITQDTGYAVIQTAIDSSINGDTVIVSPGTYVENINFNGKNIVLASDFLLTNDTSYISSTIIDGNANGSPVVRLENGETNDAKLIGFTIQNGYTAINEEGAGIDLRFSAQPTLDYLIIQNNNSQSGRGGGISCYYTNGNSTSKVILSNLTIRNNICSDVGGGIYAFNSRLNISNSKIYENSAHFAGAIGGNGPFEPIVNCEFYDNIGNLSVMSGEFDLINCSFIDNYLTNPNSNVYELDFQGTSSIINTIIASGHPIKVNGQLSISHSLIQDSISSISYPFSNALVWGAGNLTLDPSFVDSSINDFRLSNFSPCIGAGLDTSIVPTYDLDGNPRPNPAGSNPDMGAYENSLGTPWIEGCTLTIACNYNPEAVIDDGSCMFICPGCTSEDACNYDSSATVNDGSCLDFDECGFCGGDNSSCSGCTDIQACNYNPSSIINDGSCVLPETNYDCFGDCIDDTDGDGVCDQLEIFGCTDVSACNYDPNVTESDGLCDFVTCVGCMYEYACNYNPEATIEDNSSCEFGTCSGCTDPQACNYNPTLSEDDGSCEYCSCGYICVFESCGDQISHDNYAYSTVQIGDQCWFSENCRYLPSVTAYEDSNDVPMYYVYDYEGTDVGAAKATDNYETYGVLYNWPAVMTEGICPSGWHIPSDGEWQTMEISLGMSESEAAQMGWRGSPVGDYMK